MGVILPDPQFQSGCNLVVVTALLLSVHVLAAIVFIGPVTAAASLFPRYARQALAHPTERVAAAAVTRLLHRISSGYAVAGLAVPVFGIGTAVQMGVLGEVWLLVSMALTLAAGLLLALVIVPGQRRILSTLDAPDHVGRPGLLPRLGMLTGVFSLCWAVVVVLMIVRPGSTTGVGR
jgi:hypothetical protein